MITITHTRSQGSLIEGTARNDGTVDTLKANGWRWGRSIGCWYLPHSRDKSARTGTLTLTLKQLQNAGHEAELSIDDEFRTTAEVEADKIARQDARVSALQAKVETKATAESRADDRVTTLLEHVPPMGEPIKIGHHSESRHRKSIDRANAASRAALEAHNATNDARTKAEAATHTTDARYAPVTVINRIEALESSIRKCIRHIEGSTRMVNGYPETIAPATGAHLQKLIQVRNELNDKLAYWKSVHADQISAGTAPSHSAETIKKGDSVKIHGQWRQVVRVNKKSVTVETGYSWTDTAPYKLIQGHRPS